MKKKDCDRKHFFALAAFALLSQGIQQNFVYLPCKQFLILFSILIWFFALYSKNLKAPLPENSWLFTTFCCGCFYNEKNVKV